MEGVQKVQGLDVKGSFHRLGLLLALLSLGMVLSGCATLSKPDVDKRAVGLFQAQSEIPESELLGIQIEVFDPGELPESEEQARGLSKEIRNAEARYIPVQLKKAIQQTGLWGPVRVVPSRASGAEVLLSGRIINSNGEILELEIDVYDAVGHHWFSKTYAGAVDSRMYDLAEKNRTEAFQNVYNRIANDLTNYRLKMSAAQIKQIQRVAELRFAEEMAPEVFGGYLKDSDDKNSTHSLAGLFKLSSDNDLKKIFSGFFGNSEKSDVNKGVYTIERLPAKDDDMMHRVRRMRQRDDLLVDILDGHYEGLYQDMQDTYTQWRSQRTKEIQMIREVEIKQQKEIAKGVAAVFVAVLVGAAASSGSNDTYNPGIVGTSGAIAVEGVRKIFEASNIGEEAEINRAALEELGESFSADVDPIVVEVEGRTVKLTGTAQAKYQQWREVLGQLYEAETGFALETE